MQFTSILPRVGKKNTLISVENEAGIFLLEDVKKFKCFTEECLTAVLSFSSLSTYVNF